MKLEEADGHYILHEDAAVTTAGDASTDASQDLGTNDRADPGDVLDAVAVDAVAADAPDAGAMDATIADAVSLDVLDAPAMDVRDAPPEDRFDAPTVVDATDAPDVTDAPIAADRTDVPDASPSRFPSTGADGPFPGARLGPVVELEARVWNFTSISVPAGMEVRAALGVGTIELRATGDVNINGLVELSGGDGGPARTGMNVVAIGGDAATPSLPRLVDGSCFAADQRGRGGAGTEGRGGGCARGGQYGGVPGQAFVGVWPD